MTVPAATRLAAALALLLAALPAAAQEAGPDTLADPRAAKYRDVERGVFVGMEAGGLFFFKTPAPDPARFAFAREGGASKGVVVGVGAGVDLGPRLAISAFALGTSQRASLDYGAFDVMAAGLDLRVALWKRADRNGWDRLFVYGHARGAYALTHPTGLFGDSDVLVGAGVGVEYFTQLRHFSVGLQLDGLYAVQAGAPGLSLSPVVRYTF